MGVSGAIIAFTSPCFELLEEEEGRGGNSWSLRSGEKSDIYNKKEQPSNNGKIGDGSPPSLPDESLGQAEKMSKDLNKKLEEYAQDEEVIKELNEINNKSKKKKEFEQADAETEDSQSIGKKNPTGNHKEKIIF